MDQYVLICLCYEYKLSLIVSKELKSIIYFLTFILVGISCKEDVPQRDVNLNGYDAKVYLPAGEILPGLGPYSIPTFFNMAQIETKTKSINTIVFNKKVSKGKILKVEPVALLQFDLDTSVVKYMISLPVVEGESYVDSYFFDNIHLNNSLEEWFKAQSEFNKCKNFTWGNAYKALMELD